VSNWEAENSLNNIQQQIQTSGYNDTLHNQEKRAYLNLDDALNKQNLFWQEKARLSWHVDEDRNTQYFHRVSKIKNKTKSISSINIDGVNVTEPSQIDEHIVSYYNCLFSSNIVFQDFSLVEEVLPSLIDDSTNTLLTILPSKDEIKNVVFGLNGDGAPGPDGFGACFFQTHWDIVHKEVENVVLEFFTKGWILPNYNANTIILIPKSPDDDSIDKYRPIALANFKFKILSNILADRLAPILPNIISKEQRGFVQGRNIKDCIAITSEAINLLDKKCFGGNLALKIDVSKAFDTLRWDFLLKVLNSGFNSTFCH